MMLALMLLAAVELTPCDLEMTGLPRVPAKCGAIKVDDKIAVGFAVLESDREKPLADPVVFLPGGPGQAATELAPFVAHALSASRGKRDVILFDPRGTGRSTPLLCKDDRDLPTRLRATDDEEKQRLGECAAKMPFDPALVTTENIARDLEAIRVALGVERWNLVGVSYGTRLAITYDRMFPGKVRTLTLDGVVPSTMRVGEHAASDTMAALDTLAARAGDAGLRSLVEETHAKLKTAPVDITIPHPLTAKPLPMRIDHRVFAGVIRSALYAEETAALLVPMLRGVARGDFAPLAAQVAIQDKSHESLNIFVLYSVLCAEDLPFGETKEHMFDVLADMKSLCSAWPHAKLDKPPSGAVSPTPALLLSGAADPVTPPKNADEAAKELPKSARVSIKGSGHNVFLRGCLPKVVSTFIDDGGVDNLDVSCATKMGPYPLFVDALGPAP